MRKILIAAYSLALICFSVQIAAANAVTGNYYRYEYDKEFVNMFEKYSSIKKQWLNTSITQSSAIYTGNDKYRSPMIHLATQPRW